MEVDLWPFALNAMVFLCFFCIQCGHHWWEFRKHPSAGQSVRHLIFSGVFTPAGFDAVRDFLVHLLVYSGLVIPPH